MKRTVPRLEGPARQVARGELVGQPVEVVRAPDAGIVGLSGIVVDETMRTLVVRRADGREVRLGKRGNVFRFGAGTGGPAIPGDAIEFRPADRTKKVR